MIRLAISMGDPSGIGAEVIAKALAISQRGIAAYVFGDAKVWARESRRVRLQLPVIEPSAPLPRGSGAFIAVTDMPPAAARPGAPAAAGGRAQLAYLEAAYTAVNKGYAEALCTAPMAKSQVQIAAPSFVGHTEWLAKRTKTPRTVMMLASGEFRVSLVTNHIALKRVPGVLKSSRVLDTIVVTRDALRRDFGLSRARIAVCGLNPHAGENGAFGDEEARILTPAIEKARAQKINVSGPYSADALFPKAAAGNYDAVVAIYHDQGLIPVKLLHFERAVNVTLGLPIVRTSPDHGVAFDIAGKGRANAASMRGAIDLAAEIVKRRR